LPGASDMKLASIRCIDHSEEDCLVAIRVDALAERVTNSWAIPLDEFEEPIVLDRFELDRVLGHGTHGVVFAGFDRLLERDVAIKMVRAASLILPEARALARINHP